MTVLLEFYDYSTLKNILPVLATIPDRVAFFYDTRKFNYTEVYSTYLACQKHIPHLQFEVFTIDYHDSAMIEAKVNRYIKENKGDRMIIDLTGGTGLLTAVGYKASLDMGIEVVYTDVIKNSTIDLISYQERYRCMPLEITDIIEAQGGKVLAYTNDAYLHNEKKHLYTLSGKILNNITKWSKTCMYFQRNSINNKNNNSYVFEARLDSHRDSKNIRPDKDLMYEFQRHQLIKNLSFQNHMLRFEYAGKRAVDYLASYGLWLELFTYYAMCEIEELNDVKTSLKIDWNRHSDIDIVGNEIDVTAMYQSRPVIVSCKLSENGTNADALNELYVISHRIGHGFAIPVLVTYSDIKSKRLGIYMKAKEMGIIVMDRQDILDRSFSVKLKNAIIE